MAAKFRNTGPPLTADDLSPERNGLGFPLPAGYRRWLLSSNGGEPKPASFATLDGWPSKRLSIERFLSVQPPGGAVEDTVQTLYHHLVSEVGLPAHLVPIARGIGPKLLLLDTRTEDDGEVLCWDMFGDRYEFEEQEGLVAKVRVGFADLIAGLGVR
jgi:hypothetical protein